MPRTTENKVAKPVTMRERQQTDNDAANDENLIGSKQTMCKTRQSERTDNDKRREEIPRQDDKERP